MCSLLVAPVKNEAGDVIMFIINYEDVTEAAARGGGGPGDRRPGMQRECSLFVCLSVCLFVCLYVCVYICLSVRRTRGPAAQHAA